MAEDKFINLDKLILDQPDHIVLTNDGQDPEASKGDNDSDDDLEDNEGGKDPKAVSKKGDKTAAPKKEMIEIDNEEEEEEDKDVDPAAKTGDAPTHEDVLKTWAGFFKEESVLNEDDLAEFDGTEKSLSAAFNKMKVREGLEMVEDYKSQLPAMLKYLAENWEEGVPLTELLNIKSNQIRYANLTDEKLEESVDTQKAVYAEYLRKTTKYSDTKIEKEIARLIDTDELKEETKDALKDLKKVEAEAEETIRRETKKEQERRRDENAKKIKHYEKLIKETKEVIPGLAIDAKLHEDLVKKVTNPVGIDGNGNPVSYIQSIRMEDPYNFDIKLNYLMTITKGMTDFSKIATAIETKTTKKLNSLLEVKVPKGSVGTGSDGDGKKGLLDYMKLPQNKKR